jgi:hypothetical protein|tara:strand:- start:1611 stop:2120 length:510 start_codon:yes stop_codon:yes gene_type:complete
MIIGIKNVSNSLRCKGIIIKQFLLLYGLLFYSSLSSQEIDTIDFKLPEFSFTPKLFHHPHKVLFNSRIFELEVFADFPKQDIKQVSLFYRTDAVPRYIEHSFNQNEMRYVFSYDPQKQPATYITYFFTVALNNGSMFATPVDSAGTLVPITKYLLDPVEYYKKRSEIKN